MDGRCSNALKVTLDVRVEQMNKSGILCIADNVHYVLHFYNFKKLLCKGKQAKFWFNEF